MTTSIISEAFEKIPESSRMKDNTKTRMTTFIKLFEKSHHDGILFLKIIDYIKTRMTTSISSEAFEKKQKVDNRKEILK